MTLENTRKLAKHICRLLKVSEVNFPIGRTPKGNLGLVFNENNDEYAIMLDSVPLSTASIIDDENNIELKKMIDKYLFEQEKEMVHIGVDYGFSVPAHEREEIGDDISEVSQINPTEPKKRGRPAGSKNKVDGDPTN